MKVEVSKDVALPMPMAIVGTSSEGQANFMAAGWICRVNAQPPMVAIGVGRNRLSAKNILKNHVFSVNIPGKSMVPKTDYVGLVSGKRLDKSDVFKPFYGKVTNAPMIEEAPMAFECKVAKVIELPSNYLFIGEIVGALCDEKYLHNDHPDFVKMHTFFLTMHDNNYWGFGKRYGMAWNKENMNV